MRITIEQIDNGFLVKAGGYTEKENYYITLDKFFPDLENLNLSELKLDFNKKLEAENAKEEKATNTTK